MYFFTALAIGVTAAQASFWQVTFASTIQILATVLSPFTIAGEGIREIAQYGHDLSRLVPVPVASRLSQLSARRANP